jgi:hypothetical protein
MDELISQFETFSKSVSVMESMLSSCKNQMSMMEQHLVNMATTDEEKGNIVLQRKGQSISYEIEFTTKNSGAEGRFISLSSTSNGTVHFSGSI